MSHDPRRVRHLFAALYLAAGLILVDQTAETVAAILPIRADDPQWRFGAFGLAVGHTTALLVADVLMLTAAVSLDHRRFLRGWGLLHLPIALLLAATTVVFLLDAVQLRAAIQPAARSAVTLQAARASLVGSLVALFCLATAVVSWRSTRASARGPGILIDQPGGKP
ncbi:MAG: hypothetical protein SFV24_03690 [Gemmatimonadales bacterium]|nr:hypothetical protein [Gemmatimonadales bacterium]